ncbi:MAG TPA: adenylate kinase [bacterium]|nr:adenylate kinase [bacterium]
MDLIFMGPPGAGKGTQAEIFHERHGLPHISTGDILRQGVRDDTEVGRRAFAYMQEGDLVPDEIVDEIVQIRLAEPDTAGGFILDGYPRTLPQADALDRWLAREGRSLDAVVWFEIREEVLLRRLTGRRVCPVCGAIYHLDYKPPRVAVRCDVEGAELVQRRDDARATVLHRLEVFHRWTAPLVDHYRSRGLFLTVNAERPVVDVYDEIREFVQSRAGRTD